ncbi:Protein of unknown function [Pseudorhodobacter antarcticus]|jgi:hypothetical protein|uniref:DUF1523 domain-containing protein n=1 Tax=Pseudorhodobacter antarcticus TaxID=1077947 RepID=A0A1H8AII4_9RHOB|nr:DUF1523 family protein [Pseudorhodobacter antarcticus]SEM70585.1 Protein of unknown function [Pseudorhodobacter antarcticus]
MRYVKWTFIATIALLLFSFFHYTLPQKDVVRVVGTENRRIDFGENSFFWASPDLGTAAGTSRDVRFINAERPNGKIIVYRNEDTGWGWPPYFKLDSSNLQAQSQALVSTDRTAPAWVAITHYGWRNEFFSIFPNAISIRPVAGPDVTFFPWFNVVFFIFLAGVLALFYRIWAQFRERTIDPAMESIGDTIDEVDARADSLWARLKAWLATWTGKPRR